MNSRNIFAGFFGALMILMAPAPSTDAGAQEAEKVQEKTPTVQEIVDRTNRTSYYQGKDGRAKVSMTITDDQERTRTREFIILRRDDPPPEGAKIEGGEDSYCKDQKFYVYFLRPADVNKMVFMVWKHVADDQPDDRWLYMPALDLIKRIAASDKRTSFVGSHFFYEDVSGRNVSDDLHELAEATDTYYILKNTPKKPDEVEFGHFTMWIHKETYLPVKIEYFDKKGEKYREYEVLGVEKIQGFYTVMKARMKDLKGGGNTLLEYSDVKYNIDLPDDIFTERYLRRAPTKYLK